MVENPLPTIKKFIKKGVTVNFSGQGRPVLVQELPTPDLKAMPSVPGGFKPFRAVINLKLVDAAHPDQEVLTFSPPVVVRVRYTAQDLASANKAGGALSLGFWDGNQWIRFTREKHNFHLEPSAKGGGWGVVNISHWGDPTKAWGT